MTARRLPGKEGKLGGAAKKPAKKPLFETFTKCAVMFILVNAILWVWCSYGLAYLGRYEIAESLSQTAVDTILGVFVAYAVKSCVEKINEYGLNLAVRKTKKPDADERRDY